MAILTYIQGIPLFETSSEATSWGAQNGLTGYHTHAFNQRGFGLRTGYMAGSSHAQATRNYRIANPIQTQQTPTTPSTPTTGGGGGGY